MAYSSFSTGGEDLGLENNNFHTRIDIWQRLIKKQIFHEVYPEDMTDTFVACFLSFAPEDAIDNRMN